MGTIPFTPERGDVPQGWPRAAKDNPQNLPHTYESRSLLAQGDRDRARHVLNAAFERVTDRGAQSANPELLISLGHAYALVAQAEETTDVTDMAHANRPETTSYDSPEPQDKVNR